MPILVLKVVFPLVFVTFILELIDFVVEYIVLYDELLGCAGVKVGHLVVHMVVVSLHQSFCVEIVAPKRRILFLHMIKLLLHILVLLLHLHGQVRLFIAYISGIWRNQLLLCCAAETSPESRHGGALGERVTPTTAPVATVATRQRGGVVALVLLRG